MKNPKKGATVTIEPTEHIVHGDKVRLQEVLQNLIENAVKYGGDQSNPRIEIGALAEGTETVFHVPLHAADGKRVIGLRMRRRRRSV